MPISNPLSKSCQPKPTNLSKMFILLLVLLHPHLTRPWGIEPSRSHHIYLFYSDRHEIIQVTQRAQSHAWLCSTTLVEGCPLSTRAMISDHPKETFKSEATDVSQGRKVNSPLPEIWATPSSILPSQLYSVLSPTFTRWRSYSGRWPNFWHHNTKVLSTQYMLKNHQLNYKKKNPQDFSKFTIFVGPHSQLSWGTCSP